MKVVNIRIIRLLLGKKRADLKKKKKKIFFTLCSTIGQVGRIEKNFKTRTAKKIQRE